MVPMVRQAQEKGADFLMCRIPGWDDLEEVAEAVFQGTDQRSPRLYTSKDRRLGSLSGGVLFNRYNVFVTVENLHRIGRHQLAV